MNNFIVSCEVSVIWSLFVHSTDLLTFSFPFIVIRHCNLRRQKTRHLIWPQSLREPEHLPRILRLSSPRSLLVFDFLLSCHWDKNFPLKFDNRTSPLSCVVMPKSRFEIYVLILFLPGKNGRKLSNQHINMSMAVKQS